MTFTAGAPTHDGRAHALLVRLDQRGRAIEPPREIGDPTMDAGHADVLPSPRGAIATWTHEPVSAGDVVRGPRVLELDVEGGPLSPAVPVPGLRVGHRPSLRFARGRPTIFYDVGDVMPLGWNGMPIGPATRLAPFARDGVWVETDEDPWLVWDDGRHAHHEIYAAPVRCDGAVPVAKEPAPIVETTASAPPPKVARPCRTLRLAGDVAVAVAGQPGAPIGPSITTRGTELWVGWSDMRSATYPDPVGAFYVRRFRTQDAKALGGEELVLPQASSPTLLANGADASIVYELGGAVHAVRLRADGRPDEASRVDLSHPLAATAGVVAFASGARGDAFWWAGESPFLQSRSIHVGGGPLAPGPLVDVQRPDRDLMKFRVAPSRDGWVAAWLEDRTATLAVARSKDGALAWSARVSGVGNTYFVRLGAVGVVGEQIFVLLGADPPRLVRFTLDGARLDDVAFPLTDVPVIESSITERGIVAIARDGKGDGHCVHRFAFDGTSLGQPLCAKLPSAVDEDDPGRRARPPVLVWNGDTLWWAYGKPNEDVRLRRWRCE